MLPRFVTNKGLMKIKSSNIDYVRYYRGIKSMPKVDPAPLPCGPSQYYQLHFIMEMKNKDNDRFLARCKPQTSGCLLNKHIIGVKWAGEDNFVEVLETDTVLHNMLKEIVMEIGDITIDPQDDDIRTHSR